MKKINKVALIIAVGATTLCSLSLILKNSNASEAKALFTPDTTYPNKDADTYYNSIDSDKSGNDLLSDLRALNLSRRKKTMGYKTGGISASDSDFIYTDYDTSDPSTLHTDKNGQVYGTVISSFYSYQPCTSFNKEHVWPNTHGGNKVENDVHMARPTVPAENSNRGHSYYVENMAHSTNGWDPYYAFHVNPGKTGDLGAQTINSRGESARIIMYCMVATDQLVLEAGHSDSSKTSNNKMGDLVDILKWNLDIPVTDREKNRNEGAEYLQGNRNPFIDHPEYACKIWGNTNDATRKICQSTPPTPSKTLTSITVGGTATKKTYNAGEHFSTEGLTVTANYSDSSTEDVTTKSSYVVSLDPLTAGTTSVTVTYTYSGKTASKTITGLSVSSVEIPVTSVKINNSVTNFTVGGTCNLDVTVLPSNATNRSLTYKSNNTSVATVDGNGKVTFKATGSATITATSNNGKSDTITFNVSSSKIDVESVTASLSKDKYIVGDKEQIDYEVLPENATNKNVSFNSSNKNVATVDSNGNVSFIGAGEVTLYVTSNENQDIFDSITLTVEEKPAPVSKLVEIAVSSKPDKTVYSVGEPFDSTGLSVVANYLDGSSVDITGEVEFDEPDTSTEGTKTINVKFNETFKTDFDIIVLKDEVSSLKIAKYPLKTHYFESEEFNPLGIVVTAKVGGNTQDVTNLVEYEYDFSSVAQVTVKFEDLSKDIFVTIESGEITDEHKAADFAYIVEDKVQDISVDNVTLSDWEVLEHYYNALDEDAQKVLQETVTQYVNGVSAGEELSDTLMECVSKYDEIYLAHKDEGFTDFMSRNPKAPSPTPTPTPKPNGVDLMKILKVAGIVLGIIVLIVLIIVISVVASKKSKKKHA